jgi:hypothetical protein
VDNAAEKEGASDKVEKLDSGQKAGKADLGKGARGEGNFKKKRGRPKKAARGAGGEDGVSNGMRAVYGALILPNDADGPPGPNVVVYGTGTVAATVTLLHVFLQLFKCAPSGPAGLIRHIQAALSPSVGVWRPCIKGLLYPSLKDVRLPVTNDEWEEVRNALQQLGGGLKEGVTVDNALQSLKEYADKVSSQCFSLLSLPLRICSSRRRRRAANLLTVTHV